MLHPSYLELREQVVGDEEGKDLNRYSLIIGTAKRARQIIEMEGLIRKAEEKDIKVKGVSYSGKEGKVKPVSQAVAEIYGDDVHILEEDMDELY